MNTEPVLLAVTCGYPSQFAGTTNAYHVVRSDEFNLVLFKSNSGRVVNVTRRINDNEISLGFTCAIHHQSRPREYFKIVATWRQISNKI